MTIDSKLAHLLSDFFLDISKAYFIAIFVTPSLGFVTSSQELFTILTRGTITVILALWISWKFAKISN